MIDVALAGDGEPTSSQQFSAAMERVERALERSGLLGELPVILITNGSLLHRPQVADGLRRLNSMGGELWFKLDSATREGRLRLNDVDLPDERVAANLRLAAAACTTRIQCMCLALDGEGPSEVEQKALVAFLAAALQDGVWLKDVMLYGPARPSHQPEAARIAPLPTEWLEALAERIEAIGLQVQVSP